MNKKSILIIGIEIICLLFLYGFINSSYLELVPKCWVYQITGFLCPACGGTKCVIFLLKGNLIEAFFSHILFFIGIVYLLVVNVIYIINLNRKKKMAKILYPKTLYGIIFVVLLIIYTIVRNLL